MKPLKVSKKVAIRNQYKINSTFNPKTEFRSFVKVEVAVLGSPSLIVPTVSMDVKQH